MAGLWSEKGCWRSSVVRPQKTVAIDSTVSFRAGLLRANDVVQATTPPRLLLASCLELSIMIDFLVQLAKCGNAERVKHYVGSGGLS